MNNETIDSVDAPHEEIIPVVIYPSLMERVKAIMTDTVIIIIMMIIFSYVFSSIDDLPDISRKIAFVFLVALYDPLTVAFLGGTPGHLINNLKVRRSYDHSRKLNIFISFIRYGIKLILGIVSFLTISAQSEKRAIHDLFTESIVLYKDQNLN